MKRNSWLAFGVFSCLGTMVLAQSALDGNSTSVQWLSFSECPVLLERSVEVPTLESGVLGKVEVELNATVKAGQPIARLDDELAKLDLKIASLQHQAALETSKDSSDVEFLRVALREAQQELEDHRSIKSSVAAMEIRRLSLAAGRAELAVIRAEQSLKRAAIDVELKAAGVQAATMKLNRRQIVSPLNGIVTTIHVHQGQSVDAGKSIAVVADLEHLLVDCLVPIQKIDLKRIVGLEVRVESEQPTLGGKSIRLTGKIASYDPHVSSQGLVRVHAKIQNSRQGEHWELLPGMTVKLEVALPRGEPALIGRKPTQHR